METPPGFIRYKIVLGVEINMASVSKGVCLLTTAMAFWHRLRLDGLVMTIRALLNDIYKCFLVKWQDDLVFVVLRSLRNVSS